jgi:pilus assembly protein CpaB
MKARLAMRAKSLLLLTIALGCGTVAAVAVSKTLLDKSSGGEGEPTIEILVAAVDIKTASQITAEKVKLEKFPKSKIPEGAMRQVTQAEGKFASQTIFAGEAILTRKLNDSNASLATQIPSGYTIFDIHYENNYIKPGDWVDISGVFTPPGKNKTPEVQKVLNAVEVLAVNGNLDRNAENKGAKGTIFQLKIRQSQHQALLIASNLGKLDLHVRPLGGDGEIKNATDNGEDFLSWAASMHAESETTEKPVSKNTGLVMPLAAPEPKVTKQARKEMLIVTPEGVKRYYYSGNELPREALPEVEEQPKVAPQPANPWQTSSGFGGYTPTYPHTYSSAPGVPGYTNPNAPPQGLPVGQPTTPPVSQSNRTEMIN